MCPCIKQLLFYSSFFFVICTLTFLGFNMFLCHQPLISPLVIPLNKSVDASHLRVIDLYMHMCAPLHVDTCLHCEDLPIGLVVSDRPVIIYICYLYSRLHKSFHTNGCWRPVAFALKITQTLSKLTSLTRMLYLSKPLRLTGSICCVSRSCSSVDLMFRQLYLPLCYWQASGN